MPNDFANTIRIDSRECDLETVMKWASEAFLEGKYLVHHGTFPSPYWHFRFDNTEDACFFALRWLR